MPIIALMFMGCEKETKEVIVHDSIFVEFDIFKYEATAPDSFVTTIIFTDPNYPETVRYELFFDSWEYFNEIRVDEFTFQALTYGTSIELYLNDEILAQSITEIDNENYEYQYLEIQYNTSKKSAYTREELIELYKAEIKKRGL